MNTSLPLVSVIIPNYNNASYLKGCIKSLVDQTYKNIEIIVVDDCSTDDSIVFLNHLSNKYDFLSYYINSENRGVSYSRNRGVSLANGDYVTTIDPDDLYLPKKIESEVKVLLSYEDDVVVFSGYTSVDENLRKIRTNIDERNVVEGNIFKGLVYRAIPIPRDMMLKRTVLQNLGRYDESMSLYEDWDQKIKLSKKYKFYFSGVNGILYRRHNKGLSSVRYRVHAKVMETVFLKNHPKGLFFIFYLINSNNIISKSVRFILQNNFSIYVLRMLP